MIDRVSLAEQYRSAYYSGDFESLRELLADGFTFSGPVASDHVGRMVRSVETQAVFSDGHQVCAILMLTVNHDVQRFPMVEWYRFEDGRIASVQTCRPHVLVLQ